MHDFTRGHIPGQLFKFSLPMVIGDFVQTISPIIASVWIGQLLGKEAFAAVSASVPLFFFMFSWAIGISIGSNILSAQALGAKNTPLLVKIISNSLLLIIFTAVFFSAFSLIFSGRIMEWMNIPQELLEPSRIYFEIISAGFIFNFIVAWVGSVLRSFGNSKTPMLLNIVALILNSCLVPLFILGFGIIPKLGLYGAAISAIAANMVTAVLGLLFLLREKKIQHLVHLHLRPHFDIVLKVLKVGLPPSLQMLVVSVSGVLIISLVNSFGPDVIVAYGAWIRADQIAIIPAISMGMAVSVYTSQNLGAGKFERIPEIVKWGMIFSTAFAVFFTGLMVAFPENIIMLFTASKEVMSYGNALFRIIAFAYILFAIAFVYQGVVRGAGDTVLPLIFAAVGMIFFRVPLCYWLGEHTALREKGIWLGILLTSFLPVIFNYFYYKTGRWKKKVLVRTMD